MLVIAVLRSFLPAPRRGTIVVLLIAAVIASVVSMHAISGSPSIHISTHVSWATVVTDQVGSARTALDRTTEPEHPHEDGCHCHRTTAMCLAVVAGLLPLATLPAGVLSRLVVPLAQHHFRVDSHQRPMREPSLQALGICRT
ncbi:hypothetical protein [Promicromonospora sp. NPDC050880]|uniref:hypothetical protein n=1 Tax=Promicromonospora sp. NPDC050880 TaxID=3364406 RepID=UPI003797F009